MRVLQIMEGKMAKISTEERGLSFEVIVTKALISTTPYYPNTPQTFPN